jgi:hypothetical protein
MQTLVYGFALVATSFVMGLFGFFVGRCARKLPVIDDKLPWAIHRDRWPAAVGPHAVGPRAAGPHAAAAQSKRRALG